MSARPPRCFQSPSQVKQWLGSARYAPAGSSSFCADCTARFQREMIAAGLCDHPDVFFVTDPEDGTETGVKPADPKQGRLFEAA